MHFVRTELAPAQANPTLFVFSIVCNSELDEPQLYIVSREDLADMQAKVTAALGGGPAVPEPAVPTDALL